MFEFLKGRKPEDSVTQADLQKVLQELSSTPKAAVKRPRFVCPETGKVLDDVSIRKYTAWLYPDFIPNYRTNDLARERKAALLAMADEQEMSWGGSAPKGAPRGEGR